MSPRYDRQMRLPEIGQEGQKKLSGASVLCVGAGGLGSPALLYLVAAGVGRIGIIDFDRVDESNLQRQVLFNINDIGQSKAQQAARHLKVLNPEIGVRAYDEGLNAGNAVKLFRQYDIILDGTDNFETKFLINDTAIKLNKPWIYGAIQGFEGRVSVFNYQDGPCYRCLCPEKPKAQVMNCADAGVIGAVAGLVGVTQALQAIQIIIGHKSFEPLSGRVMILDTRTMETRVLGLKKDVHCPVCSVDREKIELSYNSPVCGLVPEVSITQMKEVAECTLVDVREQEEWGHGHIEGAQFWPLSKIKEGHLPDLEKSLNLILYCQRGTRSAQAALIFKEHGFLNVSSLSGGFEAWLENK